MVWSALKEADLQDSTCKCFKQSKHQVQLRSAHIPFFFPNKVIVSCIFSLADFHIFNIMQDYTLLHGLKRSLKHLYSCWIKPSCTLLHLKTWFSVSKMFSLRQRCQLNVVSVSAAVTTMCSKVEDTNLFLCSQIHFWCYLTIWGEKKNKNWTLSTHELQSTKTTMLACSKNVLGNQISAYVNMRGKGTTGWTWVFHTWA